MNKLKSRILLTTALMGFGGLTAASAYGQAVSQAAASDGNSQVEEIVVTASRVGRAGFVAPTPTTSIDAEQILQSGASSVADVLNLVPSFRPTVTATSSDSRTFSPGSNYADLRGFGSTRTLVLINGERVVPEVPSYTSSTTNQVDLNIIPTIAIRSTDVVTGGASAAYGSDAVAGVINFTLYKHYEGFEGEVEGGVSGHGDNRDVHLAGLGGTEFGGGRGHITVAGEYDNNAGIGDPFTRSWGKNNTYILAAPAPAPTGSYILAPNYSYATYAPGGLITSAGALKGTAFGPGGAPFAYPYGSIINGTGMFGGGIPGNNPQTGIYMEPPTDRWSLYSYGDYELTDTITAHVQFNHAQTDAKTVGNLFLPSVSILSGNPYIPPSVQATMTANRTAAFTLQENVITIGRPRETVNDETNRVSAGLAWDIGGSWKADAYYEYGHNDDYQNLTNVINNANVTQAVNAVNVNGQIQCANTANGCAPLNLFGVGSPSQAALNFITTNAFIDVTYEQQVAAANLHGDPFQTWAGPVSIATGVEYRYESQTDTPDAPQQAGVINGFSTHFFHGNFNVKEIYGETVVPIAHELPWINEFDLNGAIRYADYSTTHGATTWKLGATWNVTDDLLLRATKSRDIRAPNLTELYFPTTLAGQTTISGQAVQANSYSGGNPNLKDEVAKSTTAGITYSPHYIPGLHASVDYFDIDLADAISISNGATISSACSQGFKAFCDLETVNGGVVTTINAVFANLSSIVTRGYDVELSYTTPLSSFAETLPGTMTLRALGTYTTALDYQVGPGLPNYNHAGQVNSGLLNNVPFFTPKFRGSFTANYTLDRFSGTLVANYIAPGKTDTTITTAQYAANNVPGYVTFNLLGSYEILNDKRLEIFGAINNLFDKAPPYDPSALLNIPTDAALYDVIGRTFKVGLRFKL